MMNNNNKQQQTQLSTSKFFSPPSMPFFIPTLSLTSFTSFATIRPWLHNQWLWPNCYKIVKNVNRSVSIRERRISIRGRRVRIIDVCKRSNNGRRG